MSMTTSFLNRIRKSRATCAMNTTASASLPLTWKIGACTSLATSVQYRVERESRGSLVVNPIWLFTTMCMVPPVP